MSSDEGIIRAAEKLLLAKHRAELRVLLNQFYPADLHLTDVLALIAVLGPVAERASAERVTVEKQRPVRQLKMVQ